MTKEIWINLPVKDVSQSKTFFTNIGFTLNPQHPNNDEAASIVIGDKGVILMLFPEETLKSFMKHGLTNTDQSNEVMFSISAESREEVDELAKKVSAAGGTVFSVPEEIQGWMYGCGFTDLDGHRWNVLFMDMDKMPKG